MTPATDGTYTWPLVKAYVKQCKNTAGKYTLQAYVKNNGYEAIPGASVEFTFKPFVVEVTNSNRDSSLAPQEGDTLTANVVSYDDRFIDKAKIKYQWRRQIGSGNSELIQASDNSQYVLVSDDIEGTIYCEAISIAVGFTATAKSAETEAVVPANTYPTVELTGSFSGAIGSDANVYVGETLTATASRSTGDSFTYQWYRGETAISGATENTYTVAEADADSTLKVVATVANTSYSATATTGVAKKAELKIEGTNLVLTGYAGSESPRIKLSDAPVYASMGSATDGTYTLPLVEVYAHQKGNTANNYTVQAYVKDAVSSNMVAIPNAAVNFTYTPFIVEVTNNNRDSSLAPQVGDVLTVNVVSHDTRFIDVSGSKYNWRGGPETLGTEASYTVTSDLERVEAVYPTTNGSTTSFHFLFPTILSAPTVTITGNISGEVGSDAGVCVGEILTATASRSDGDSFAYQWYRVKDGKETAIESATGNTYTVAEADENSTLKVVATVDEYYSATATTGVAKKAKLTIDEENLQVVLTGYSGSEKPWVKLGDLGSLDMTLTDGTYTMPLVAAYIAQHINRNPSGKYTLQAYVGADRNNLTILPNASVEFEYEIFKVEWKNESRDSSLVPQVGDTLTAHVSYDTRFIDSKDLQYKWQDKNGADLGTGASYTIINDSLHYLHVGYACAPYGNIGSTCTFSTILPAPTVTITGNISGAVGSDTNVCVGETLTAAASRSDGDSFTYQWYRGETAIEGATEDTYAVVPADAGSTLKVVATVDEHYSATATTGVAKQAELKIVGTNLVLTGYAGSVVPYIGTTNKVMHAMEPADDGSYRTALVSVYMNLCNNAAGSCTLAAFIPMTSVAGYEAIPNGSMNFTYTPFKIAVKNLTRDSGLAPQEGDVLEAYVADYDDRFISLENEDIHYNWTGFTAENVAAAQTLPSDAVGKKISVVAEYISSQSAVSLSSCEYEIPSAVVAAGTYPEVSIIKGSEAVTAETAICAGETLTARVENATATDAFNYQWYRDGAAISGANLNTYTPTVDDIGHALRVEVKKLVNETPYSDSASTGVVKHGTIEFAYGYGDGKEYLKNLAPGGSYLLTMYNAAGAKVGSSVGFSVANGNSSATVYYYDAFTPFAESLAVGETAKYTVKVAFNGEVLAAKDGEYTRAAYDIVVDGDIFICKGLIPGKSYTGVVYYKKIDDAEFTQWERKRCSTNSNVFSASAYDGLAENKFIEDGTVYVYYMELMDGDTLLDTSEQLKYYRSKLTLDPETMIVTGAAFDPSLTYTLSIVTQPENKVLKIDSAFKTEEDGSFTFNIGNADAVKPYLKIFGDHTYKFMVKETGATSYKSVEGSYSVPMDVSITKGEDTVTAESLVLPDETLAVNVNNGPTADISNTTATYTYQWYRDGEKIDGETAETHRLVTADAGHEVKAVVTAAYGEKTYTVETVAVKVTDPTPVVSIKKADDSVVGSNTNVNVGEPLTAVVTNPVEGATYIYRWYRVGSNDTQLYGASPDYTPSINTINCSLKVEVAFQSTSGFYYTGEAYTDVVLPADTGKLTIDYDSKLIKYTGTVADGGKLQLDIGTGSPVEMTETNAEGYTYPLQKAYEANCQNPAGKYIIWAVEKTKTTQETVGYAIFEYKPFEVVLTNENRDSSLAPQVGDVIQVSAKYDDRFVNSPVYKATYDDGTEGGKIITLGTGEKITVTEAMIGKTITVSATVRETYGTGDNSATYTYTAIPATTLPVVAMTLTGSFSGTIGSDTAVYVGETLTAAAKRGEGETFTYQWYRGETAIEGATKAEYTPTDADEGSNLTVKASVDGKCIVTATTGVVNKAKLTIDEENLQLVLTGYEGSGRPYIAVDDGYLYIENGMLPLETVYSELSHDTAGKYTLQAYVKINGEWIAIPNASVEFTYTPFVVELTNSNRNSSYAPQEGDTLTANVISYDKRFINVSDASKFQYIWIVNDVNIGTSNSLTVSAMAGSSINCYVSYNNGSRTFTAEANSLPVVAANSYPVVTIKDADGNAITKDSLILPGDQLVATAVRNNETIDCAWYSDNGVTNNGSHTVSGSDVGHVLTAKATVGDFTGEASTPKVLNPIITANMNAKVLTVSGLEPGKEWTVNAGGEPAKVIANSDGEIVKDIEGLPTTPGVYNVTFSIQYAGRSISKTVAYTVPGLKEVRNFKIGVSGDPNTTYTLTFNEEVPVSVTTDATGSAVYDLTNMWLENYTMGEAVSLDVVMSDAYGTKVAGETFNVPAPTLTIPVWTDESTKSNWTYALTAPNSAGLVYRVAFEGCPEFVPSDFFAEYCNNTLRMNAQQAKLIAYAYAGDAPVRIAETTLDWTGFGATLSSNNPEVGDTLTVNAYSFFGVDGYEWVLSNPVTGKQETITGATGSSIEVSADYRGMYLSVVAKNEVFQWGDTALIPLESGTPNVTVTGTDSYAYVDTLTPGDTLTGNMTLNWSVDGDLKAVSKTFQITPDMLGKTIAASSSDQTLDLGSVGFEGVPTDGLDAGDTAAIRNLDYLVANDYTISWTADTIMAGEVDKPLLITSDLPGMTVKAAVQHANSSEVHTVDFGVVRGEPFLGVNVDGLAQNSDSGVPTICWTREGQPLTAIPENAVEPCTYQWYKNGSAIADETKATYSGAVQGDTNIYVEVTDATGVMQQSEVIDVVYPSATIPSAEWNGTKLTIRNLSLPVGDFTENAELIVSVSAGSKLMPFQLEKQEDGSYVTDIFSMAVMCAGSKLSFRLRWEETVNGSAISCNDYTVSLPTRKVSAVDIAQDTVYAGNPVITLKDADASADIRLSEIATQAEVKLFDADGRNAGYGTISNGLLSGAPEYAVALKLNAMSNGNGNVVVGGDHKSVKYVPWGLAVDANGVAKWNDQGFAYASGTGIDYRVKLIDANGNAVKDSDGNDIVQYVKGATQYNLADFIVENRFLSVVSAGEYRFMVQSSPDGSNKYESPVSADSFHYTALGFDRQTYSIQAADLSKTLGEFFTLTGSLAGRNDLGQSFKTTNADFSGSRTVFDLLTYGMPESIKLQQDFLAVDAGANTATLDWSAIAPKVSGLPIMGQTLTISNLVANDKYEINLFDMQEGSYGYKGEWTADQTTFSYLLKDQDWVGKYVVIRRKITDADGYTYTVYSEPFGPIISNELTVTLDRDSYNMGDDVSYTITGFYGERSGEITWHYRLTDGTEGTFTGLTPDIPGIRGGKIWLEVTNENLNGNPVVIQSGKSEEITVNSGVTLSVDTTSGSQTYGMMTISGLDFEPGVGFQLRWAGGGTAMSTETIPVDKGAEEVDAFKCLQTYAPISLMLCDGNTVLAYIRVERSSAQLTAATINRHTHKTIGEMVELDDAEAGARLKLVPNLELVVACYDANLERICDANGIERVYSMDYPLSSLPAEAKYLGLLDASDGETVYHMSEVPNIELVNTPTLSVSVNAAIPQVDHVMRAVVTGYENSCVLRCQWYSGADQATMTEIPNATDAYFAPDESLLGQKLFVKVWCEDSTVDTSVIAETQPVILPPAEYTVFIPAGVTVGSEPATLEITASDVKYIASGASVEVTLDSANDFVLKQDGVTGGFSYTIMDGASIVDESTVMKFTAAGSKNLTLTMTDAALPAGTYSDELTFKVGLSEE